MIGCKNTYFLSIRQIKSRISNYNKKNKIALVEGDFTIIATTVSLLLFPWRVPMPG